MRRHVIRQPMKKWFALILWIEALTPFTAESQPPPGTLAGFLSGQGLAGAKLERRFGNHLFVPASANNKHAALMIDTGAPVTITQKQRRDIWAKRRKHHHQRRQNFWEKMGALWSEHGEEHRPGQLRGHQCASRAGRDIRHERRRARPSQIYDCSAQGVKYGISKCFSIALSF